MAAFESATGDSPSERPCPTPPPAADQSCHELPVGNLPGLDDTEQRCWQNFRESSAQLCELLNRLLIERHGLSLFDVRLLQFLAKSDDGSARMGDLADALILIPSRVTQQTRRLEVQGLTRRSTHKGDRRGVVATITRDGRTRLQLALKTYARAVHKHYLGQLSRQQMTALGDSSRRINTPLK